jgi:hypothetical protein
MAKYSRQDKSIPCPNCGMLNVVNFAVGVTFSQIIWKDCPHCHVFIRIELAVDGSLSAEKAHAA